MNTGNGRETKKGERDWSDDGVIMGGERTPGREGTSVLKAGEISRLEKD